MPSYSKNSARGFREGYGRAAGQAIGGKVGGLIGDAIPIPGAGSIGKAAGKALGGLAGGAIGSTGRRGVTKGYRDFVDAEFAKAASGASMVDDRERLVFQQKAQQAAEQANQAQITNLNQAAMAGGPVQAGALRRGAADIANVSTDAQVKASGAADQYAARLDLQRRNAALERGGQMMSYEDRLMAAERDKGRKAAMAAAKGIDSAADEAAEAGKEMTGISVPQDDPLLNEEMARQFGAKAADTLASWFKL